MSASSQTRFGQDAVTIRKIVRRMAGRSQARLVECDDGLWYVAKFLGNPQGNRTLVNEFLGAKIINMVGVSTPQIRILRLPPSLVQSNPITFQIGNELTSPEGDLHLGSQCPVHPEKAAIFDFMPRKLLPKVENLTDFAIIFVLDRWLCNTDHRQAIFFRNDAGVFRASFIDHGMCLGGSLWELLDLLPGKLATLNPVYGMVDMKSLTKRAIDQIQNISQEQLSAFISQIPTLWLAPQDHQGLDELIVQLRQRQLRLSDLILGANHQSKDL